MALNPGQFLNLGAEVGKQEVFFFVISTRNGGDGISLQVCAEVGLWCPQNFFEGFPGLADAARAQITQLHHRLG